MSDPYPSRLRWLLFLACLLIAPPISGIAVATVLRGRGDPESRAIGRQCLVVSVAGFVFLCACSGILSVLLAGLLGSASAPA